MADLQDSGWLVPPYVTEPGYWDSNGGGLMLSDAESTSGIWSYAYDNWEQFVILVLEDQDTDDDVE